MKLFIVQHYLISTCFQILLVDVNKLASLPAEIGQLTKLQNLHSGMRFLMS